MLKNNIEGSRWAWIFWASCATAYDWNAIGESVRKTNRAMVAYTGRSRLLSPETRRGTSIQAHHFHTDHLAPD